MQNTVSRRKLIDRCSTCRVHVSSTLHLTQSYGLLEQRLLATRLSLFTYAHQSRASVPYPIAPSDYALDFR
ncbi:hypothetical protein PISMIDRAFT_679449 [Pisolithus microcarpus 441]|uniref:Uncharacterized protein n=1 Tax=Pisolithus microcarpus 441 TaxID=765257 RepID=A0A0C9ZLT0_9AGAM|nr:hypothetical protein PISMIDRAFT_679449 [Pisolithus microcarpus 441]